MTAVDAAGGSDAAGAPLGRPLIVAETASLTVSLERGGRRREILHGVDLRVHQGEILAVVGESGSGKSVLGRTLLGLLPHRSSPVIGGSVVVDGVDLLSSGPTALRQLRRERLGAVFQDSASSLNPSAKVGRQIDEASGSRSETLVLLDRVGVPAAAERVHAYPHELSGGLRQRVAIAMAVARAPRLIVCDEPTTALDVTVQAQILDLLVSLQVEHGTALFFITHDLGVAAEIADRIAVMSDGEIVEEGPAVGVIEAPAHSYTRDLLGSRVRLDTPLPPKPAGGAPANSSNPRCGTALVARGVGVVYRHRGSAFRAGERFDALPTSRSRWRRASASGWSARAAPESRHSCACSLVLRTRRPAASSEWVTRSPRSSSRMPGSP
jgi:peptide/nickel transport system ATP-binding protein